MMVNDFKYQCALKDLRLNLINGIKANRSLKAHFREWNVDPLIVGALFEYQIVINQGSKFKPFYKWNEKAENPDANTVKYLKYWMKCKRNKLI